MHTVALRFLVLLTLGTWTLYASEADALVEQLKKTAAAGAGINSEEQNVATKLRVVGAPAIPLLLPLLRHENNDVRDLASYTLRDMEGLSEDHLDELIDSVRRGDGWIPPAIARIGTTKAIRFLFEEHVRQRQTQTQLTWAISMLGEKAVPGLIALYESQKNWDDDLESATHQILRELGGKAALAVEPLTKLGQNESLPESQRIRALKAIGAIGRAAEPAVSRLLALRSHQSSGIKEAATMALLSIGANEAAPMRVEQLQTAKSSFERTLILRDIAEMGERGITAGSAVLKYLDDPDWTVRVCAASALGYIRYTESSDALIPLLKNEDDWRLVWTAAQSLGRLQAGQAAPTLNAVGRDHWFPPVRAAAVQAAMAARTKPPGGGDESKEKGHFPSEFFSYEHAGRDLESIEPSEVNSIRYPSPARAEQFFDMPIRLKYGKMSKQRRQGVKIASGYLLSEDRGEWGGAIHFVDSKGSVTQIKEVNTHAIYQTPRGIVALTGLAHLSFNSGMLMRLTEQPDGRWIATNWRALPGAPSFSRLLEDGRILVACSGGIVLISPEGSMKIASRKDLGLK